jgi:hypothetical protein
VRPRQKLRAKETVGGFIDMAAVSPNPVSEETIRSHQATWIAFTKFMKLSIAGVIAVLVLLAIFTL